MKKVSGTKEWAAANINCVTGCDHDCRYCYARANALRFARISSPEEWSKPQIRKRDVDKNYGKKKGTVMFPTTHDITPYTLDACLIVLEKLVKAGNNVLIVSKPHTECIQAIREKLKDYKSQILFRFTIGTYDNTILKYWEPNAPTFIERFDSLAFAHADGFRTSVSCEPMLDGPNIVKLFHMLKPAVSHSIWIGKLNKIRHRVKCETPEDELQISRIEAGQTNERIWEIYSALKDEPLIRWKESFKSVLGLPLAGEVGLDI